LALLAPASRAADHIDSPAAFADPACDITDVYTWTTSDASKVNLVMDLYLDAPAGAMFSPDKQYVFHVNSSAMFGAAPTETLVMCTFAPNQRAQCWVGDQDYVGDIAPDTATTSDSGMTQVYAGLRDDPFFFNLAGFGAVDAA